MTLEEAAVVARQWVETELGMNETTKWLAVGELGVRWVIMKDFSEMVRSVADLIAKANP